MPGMTTETLISDVLTIFIGTEAFRNVSNILAATPGLETIPLPTIDTFANPTSKSARR